MQIEERLSSVMTAIKPCVAWAEKLAARHPDDLSTRERADLAAHVAACAACAAVQAQYEALSQRVRHASSVHAFATPATAFPPSNARGAASEDASPVPGMITRRYATHGRRRPARPAFVARLACVAVLVAVLLSALALLYRLDQITMFTVAGLARPTISVAARPTRLPEPIPSDGFTVVGKPSISVEQINAILAYYHSPAVGKGQALYDLGVRYHIDPAFALAFFMHESSFGSAGEARKTLSLGNLRCMPAYPCVDQSRGGYARFKSWEDGFAAWYKLIHTLYVEQNKLTTVNQIILLYAPPPPNDEQEYRAYAASINRAMALWRSGRIAL